MQEKGGVRLVRRRVRDDIPDRDRVAVRLGHHIPGPRVERRDRERRMGGVSQHGEEPDWPPTIQPDDEIAGQLVGDRGGKLRRFGRVGHPTLDLELDYPQDPLRDSVRLHDMANRHVPRSFRALMNRERTSPFSPFFLSRGAAGWPPS